MDNTIMIHAGHYVDCTLGVTFGLSTLAAAVSSCLKRCAIEELMHGLNHSLNRATYTHRV